MKKLKLIIVVILLFTISCKSTYTVLKVGLPKYTKNGTMAPYLLKAAKGDTISIWAINHAYSVKQVIKLSESQIKRFRTLAP